MKRYIYLFIIPLITILLIFAAKSLAQSIDNIPQDSKTFQNMAQCNSMMNSMMGEEMMNPMMNPMMGKKKMNPMMSKGMGILYLSEELNLSEEQREKIFNAILQTRQKNSSLNLELLKIRYELLKEESKPKPDYNKIKDLNGKISKIRSEIYLNNMNLKVDIMSILTPEQVKKLKYLRK